MASVPSGASGYGAPRDITGSLAVLYYSLEIAAIILIGLGILPALFTGRVSRTLTWYSFMFSWMWYSTANVILAGRRSSTEPPFALCLFQAGLIYASPVFTCATGLAFIVEVGTLLGNMAAPLLFFQLYLRLGSLAPGLPISRLRVVPLIVLPLLLNLTVFLKVVIYGLDNKSTVHLNSSHLYCHIGTNIQLKFASLLVILLVVPTVVIEALTATTLYWKYKNIRNMEPTSPFSLTLFVQTVFFTFVAIIGLTIGAIGLKNPNPILQTGQTAAQASVPIACALVFLTQMDIVQSWSLRHPSSSTRSSTKPSPSAV
ncbi:hypothetical protein MVEN_00987000 [Mycena venus]|uniref:Uncharacterized protein n=1 Tax=Mycena venus TaxID=2733690 RepID=A0A8H6YCL4_9AGAR|nr:hypothetical protein MVEN_00987000 [Mycena venus]